jgi:hypothetical protein
MRSTFTAMITQHGMALAFATTFTSTTWRTHTYTRWSTLGRPSESIALHLGTGKGNSILEVISMADQVTGLPVKRRFCSRRPGDPPILVADASQAEKTLQCCSTRSLRCFLRTAWNWKRKDVQAFSGSLAGCAISEVTGQARFTP